MGLTLTKEELCTITCNVEKVFTTVQHLEERLNKRGSNSSMEEGLELLIYMHLLNELQYNSEYQDDTYRTILSNKDVFTIHNRALQIESNTKRRIL